MNIEWERIAKDAEESPRGILADWLATVEDYDAIIVIGRKRNDDLQMSYSAGLRLTEMLGLLEIAKASLLEMPD